MKSKQKLSIVIPVFNEHDLLETMVTNLMSTLEEIEAEPEILLVDDGSSDGTPETIARLCSDNDVINSLTLSRNFGKEAAIHAGIARSSGDCVLVMDADLQHPPSLIPEMVAAWQSGALVVEAVKREPVRTGLVNRLGAVVFYRLYKRLSGLEITNHSDFKLLDRSVADLYLQMKEKHRFFRGLVHWMGLDAVQLTFDAGPSSQRSSRWSSFGLIKYALNNISSFTTLPLQVITFMGVGVVLLGAVLGVWTLGDKLLGQSAEGFTTINLLLIILGGAIMTSLGILGHYIGKIYEEVKDRPDYIVKPAVKDRNGDDP